MLRELIILLETSSRPRMSLSFVRLEAMEHVIRPGVDFFIRERDSFCATSCAAQSLDAGGLMWADE